MNYFIALMIGVLTLTTVYAAKPKKKQKFVRPSKFTRN
jgi:hypothetical protein